MGVETLSAYARCSPVVGLIVKLNNPQMGTETIIPSTIRTLVIEYHVKLNNPQMGTETCFRVTAYSLLSSRVKLNNPHKGAEAQRWLVIGQPNQVSLLNLIVPIRGQKN